MAIEEDPPAEVPAWFVTFADMMSLLLTFFIMIVSMSELKHDKKFEQLLDSMRTQFGEQDWSSPSSISGGESLDPVLAIQGRLRRNDLLGQHPGDATITSESEQALPSASESGQVCGVIVFDGETLRLSGPAYAELRSVAQQLAGAMGSIEVRGHASAAPIDPNSGYRDHWELAFLQGRTVADFLVREGISAERIRVSSAGALVPSSTGAGQATPISGSRVEVRIAAESRATR